MNDPTADLLPPELLAALAAYLDEEEDLPALDRACAIATTQRFAIDALFEFLHGYRCDPQRRAIARQRLRATLKLPVIPGPVCRN